jgi:glycosyltransferase involved in cell wall biosynthesis
VSDRVVVIGDPNSIFVQAPVRYWRRAGIDAVILTARWTGPAVVAGAIPVVAAEAFAPERVRHVADSLVPLLDAVNAASLACDTDRVRHALQHWEDSAVPPSVTPSLYDSLIIAAAADALQPRCVLGHEVFAYGLATALCRTPRRALFAWGADVLQYAAMSDVASAMVRLALHGVQYVVTTAPAMAKAVSERFDLPRDRLAVVSYGVDRQQFCRATGERAARIRSAHGIAPGARIVMNIRRFLPHWGSAVAWSAMLDAALQCPDVHLVLLGGTRSEAGVTETLESARRRGLGDRITVTHGDVPLDTVADLMSVSDVALSLVAPLEPLSWSVLQAMACDSAVIIGDQPTYRHERSRGMSAVLVPADDAPDTSRAIVDLLQDDSLRARMRVENDRYLTEHQDQHAHMTRLLRIVAGSDTAARLLTTPGSV